jgi:hypothetical protein
MVNPASRKPEVKLRYVVLHHTGIEPPHFDLMFETSPGSKLATWRCPQWPPKPNDSFTPLGDHRRDYLDYQGEISGQRGRVSRVAAGELQSYDPSSDRILVALDIGTQISLPKLK